MKPNIADRIAEIRRLIERSAGKYFPDSVENYRKIHTNAIPWLTELIGEVERQAEVIAELELRNADLVGERVDAKQEIERLRNVLEWYADNSNYKLGETTLGNRAMEALRDG